MIFHDEGAGGVRQKVIFHDERGRGVRQKVILYDKGGLGQTKILSHSLICLSTNMRGQSVIKRFFVNIMGRWR